MVFFGLGKGKKLDFIFDIDGTLANCSKRTHYLLQAHKDWNSFYAEMPEDEPILDMIYLLQTLFNVVSELGVVANRIMLVTGRPESYKDVTKAWLKKNCIYYDALYMRKADDHRADDVIKLELLAQLRKDGYDPKMVFEDRTRVVEMWRGQGLLCCQCASGDF